MADDASHAQGIEEFLDHIYAIDREVRLNECFDPGAAEPCNPGAKQPGAIILDFGDIRSLLANGGYAQSAIVTPEPNRFLLAYTKADMCFLVINSSPGCTKTNRLGCCSTPNKINGTG